MSDTTIDDIFAEFGRKCSPVATLRNVDNPLVRREYIDQAKSALYDLMLEVIGVDDRIIELSGNSRFDQQVTSQVNGANDLRAEQRNKLKELFDET